MPEATDIIMLTHNRLEHLIATIEALEKRTRWPHRLTIVDNASEPDVRNWLTANRKRFHQLLLRPRNEFLRSLNAGIAATESDPFIVTDPDLIVPELDPCWLTRLHAILDRHPDFGLLGIGLDQSNLPEVQARERIEPNEIVDGEIVERPVGSVFTLIRRAALRSSYVTDWATCQSVARAGYRYGWTPGVRAYHLGWDDFRLYPSHLANKLKYGEYREVNLIERAPSLTELAVAGPVIATTRAAGIPDAALLELTWNGPRVGAALPEAVTVERPPSDRLPFDDGAAGAVVLVAPPGDHVETLLREAARVAVRMVIAVASLESFMGRSAVELAPRGWGGREAAGTGDLPLALARAAGTEDEMRDLVGVSTLENRESWLALFAAGAFGQGETRLWIWEPPGAPRRAPGAVAYDAGRVRRWEPVATPPPRPRRTLGTRVRERTARAARVAMEHLRLRLRRARPSRQGS